MFNQIKRSVWTCEATFSEMFSSRYGLATQSGQFFHNSAASPNKTETATEKLVAKPRRTFSLTFIYRKNMIEKKSGFPNKAIRILSSLSYTKQNDNSIFATSNPKAVRSRLIKKSVLSDNNKPLFLENVPIMFSEFAAGVAFQIESCSENIFKSPPK